MPDDLAEAGPFPAGHAGHRLDHRAFPLLAHSREQQAERLGGHRPLLRQVVSEGERVEQAGCGSAQGQHARLAAPLLQQLDQRFSVPLGVDHGHGDATQRELHDEQKRERGLAAAGLTGDGDRGRPVERRGQQRVEVDDGPGPAQGLADVRTYPARGSGDPVPQAHGGRGHAAGDRVQRLALHIGTQPDPVTRQRLAEQRELVSGGVDHVDAHVPVVLHDRLDPPHAQLPGRPGHDEPVPAVDERQALLRDAVLQHASGHELLGEREGRVRPRLPDMGVHVPRVREFAPDVLARLRRGDQPHP